MCSKQVEWLVKIFRYFRFKTSLGFLHQHFEKARSPPVPDQQDTISCYFTDRDLSNAICGVILAITFSHGAAFYRINMSEYNVM